MKAEILVPPCNSRNRALNIGLSCPRPNPALKVGTRSITWGGQEGDMPQGGVPRSPIPLSACTSQLHIAAARAVCIMGHNFGNCNFVVAAELTAAKGGNWPHFLPLTSATFAFPTWASTAKE